MLQACELVELLNHLVTQFKVRDVLKEVFTEANTPTRAFRDFLSLDTCRDLFAAFSMKSL